MDNPVNFESNRYIPPTAPSLGFRSDSATDEIPQGHETVLVIDDDPQVRDVTALTLEWLGYTVLSAESGSQAIGIAEAYPGPIDVALLDLIMPEMGGAEALPLLKRAKPGMNIVINSGYSNDSLPEGAAVSGYLSKPYGPIELSQAVRAALA